MAMREASGLHISDYANDDNLHKYIALCAKYHEQVAVEAVDKLIPHKRSPTESRFNLYNGGEVKEAIRIAFKDKK